MSLNIGYIVQGLKTGVMEALASYYSCFKPSTNTADILRHKLFIVFILQLILYIACALKDQKIAFISISLMVSSGPHNNIKITHSVEDLKVSQKRISNDQQ